MPPPALTSAPAPSRCPQAPLAGPAEVNAFISQLNSEYNRAHLEYEENFWSTKMGLRGASADALSATKTALDAFLADPARLAAVRRQLQAPGLTPEQRHVLGCMEKTFQVGWGDGWFWGAVWVGC